MFRWKLVLICTLFLYGCDSKSPSNDMYKNETHLEFVKRYVQTVNQDISSSEFSDFWYEKARKYVHDTDEALQRELNQAAGIHAILLSDNTLSNTPDVNEWGDAANTTSVTYTLNQPAMFSMPELPTSGDAPWLQYQITVERENDKWVVSGESFIR